MPEVLARPPALPLLGPSHEPQLPHFSRPDQTALDADLLNHMLRELAAALNTPAPVSDGRPADGRRLFLFHPDALLEPGPLAFVGFRGERQTDVTPDVESAVHALDAALIDHIQDGGMPGVLGYSCWQLDDGNWINLVVVRGLAEIAGWHRHALHRQASAQWSHRYYTSVRLHNGLLPEGVGGTLTVSSTKYFDFRSAPLWAAQRIFTAV